MSGCGGFINISQNSRKVVFIGTFTSGGLEAEVTGGRLRILKEGKHSKFVEQVGQITFSGRRAAELSKEIFYVTERCVFALRPEGLELIEIALGTAGYALFANYLGSYVVAIATLPTIHLIVVLEERELAERFGDAFEEYRRRVPRYVPRRRAKGDGAPRA